MQNQNKPWLVGFGRCNIRLKNKKSFLPLPDIFPSEKPQNNRGIFLFLNYSTVLNLILIPSCTLDIALLAVHVCFVIKKNCSLPSGFSVLCSDLDMIRAQSGVLWHLLAFIKVWKRNKSCSIFPASGCMEHFFFPFGIQMFHQKASTGFAAFEEMTPIVVNFVKTLFNADRCR